MIPVSFVDIKAPVSLRPCVSSNSFLAHRHTRLQSFSPVKRATVFKSRTPDLGRQIIASPKVQAFEGTLLVSSPAESPVPRSSFTPYSGRQSRVACDEFSSSEWLDDFSDEDIGDGLDTEDDELADKQKLFVVGCRPKIRGQYEVPSLDETYEKNPYLNDDENASDREWLSSPNNPPPSPINFLSSFDGLVVGGQKLVCPEKSKTSQGNSFKHRDFVPGRVKHPLRLCKGESRVVEEEQSEVDLQQRRSFVLNNRISSHNVSCPDESLTSVGSRLGRDSRMLLASLHSMSPGFMSPDGNHDKTFIETYLEKKKLKEEKDRELEEQRKRKREKRRNEEDMKKKAIEVKLISEMNEKRQHSKQGISVENINRSSSNFVESDSMLNRLKYMACSSSETVKEPGSVPVKYTSTCKVRSRSPDGYMHPPEIERLQLRRCWSDIWPFPCNVEFKTQSEDDLFSYNLCNFRSKSRITPFCPLLRPPDYNIPESKIDPVTNKDDSLEKPTSLPVEVTNDDIQTPPQTPAIQTPPQTPDNVTTMTATIIVPPRDASCNQWVTFSSENEPVLNNAPDVDDGCDTFLKRLQRTKMLSYSDPAQPAGQFCFEAVVDKRYNRWKRRRRKKKEDEHKRAVRPSETESSDDADDKNPVVEQILDRMYDQIHGPPPLTPNGTRDTPRLRNQRRRKDELKLTPPSDACVANYDASSERTSSDKDSEHISSSNSGLVQSVENMNSDGLRELNSSEDLCCWPYLEQYKQEIWKKIRNTPSEQLEEMDQKDWLPDITAHNTGRSSKTSQRSENDDHTLDDSDAKILEHFTALRSRERSYSTSTTLSNKSAKVNNKPAVTRDAKASPNTYTKRSRLNQQSLRNSYPSTQKPKVLPRKEASSWSELENRQKLAKKIGLAAMDQNDLGNSFKASLRSIKRDDLTLSAQPKQTKEPSKDQPKMKTYSINLPALSKNLKSQTIPQNVRGDNVTAKGRKKPQKPISGKSVISRQHLSRPKTQPVRNQDREEQVDPNLTFRDHYLKAFYNERLRVNSHVGGKQLKKSLTVDQLDLGRRKKRADDVKLSDLEFTRSFTFSMFDLPEVYKMYNSSLIRKASGEIIDTSD